MSGAECTICFGCIVHLQRAGTPGQGRSSSADAAANAMTALKSSLVIAGKLPRISPSLHPTARLARIVRNSTRVPPDDRLTAADLRVSNDEVVAVHG